MMKQGTLPGVDRAASRLVLGVDNQTNIEQASRIFDEFMEQGGNTFDTAYAYGAGLQERLLGQWMANRGSRRHVVVIGKGGLTPTCDPESVSRQLQTSLERLQTDRIDLYLLHRDNLDVPVAEFVDVLEEHVQAGRIGAYGGSNWTIPRFVEAQEYAREKGGRGFAVLSNHFGLARALDVPWPGCQHVTSAHDRRWLEISRTTLMPWSSQARGFFARADPRDRSDAELVRCYFSTDNFERLSRARQLARVWGASPTAIALSYVLAQTFPTFPIIGPRSIDELRASAEALSIELTEEQVRWLDLRDG